ncbi:MAG: hypothetical protein K2K31_02180 [Clostridia bacterium]|nr:hypothetical protein [Clostridia bacterium]
MKRLLRVGIGLFAFSLFPIISWLLLAVTLGDPNIANVFSLTYPIQFIWALLRSVFGTGANIKGIKEKNENAVLSSMTLGIIVGAIIFGLIAIFIEPYINFMSMDVAVYKNFALYSVMQLFIQLVFSFVLEKLYFEEKDKIASIHSLIFNGLNFAVLILTSLITKNQIIIIAVTLAVIALYVIGLLIWQYRKFKMDFNILTNFKYESMSICSEIFMFTIYFFGFSNAFQSGGEYIVAINFASLVTDTQWDTMGAISTIAKIDISKDKFNLKKSLFNSILFTLILISSSLILFFALYQVYNVVLLIGLIILAIQIGDMILDSVRLNLYIFLQLKYSSVVNTTVVIVCKIIRTVLSVFLPTPYCTDIGQIVDSLIMFTT